MLNRTTVEYTLVSLLSVGLFVYGYYNLGISEDAYIIFEYSKSLAERGIIAYGEQSHPEDGVTPFLWMLILTVGLKLTPLSLSIVALSLSAAANVGCYYLLRRVLNPVLATVTVFGTLFIIGSLTGFATGAFLLLYLSTLMLVLRRESGDVPLIYGSVLLTCLMRADGLIFLAPIILLQLYWAYQHKHLRENLLGLMILLVLPGLVYLAMRATYFGYVIPNPVLVKSQIERDFGLFFVYSVRTVGVVAIPCLVAVWMVYKQSQDKALTLLTLGVVILPTLYLSSVWSITQNVGLRLEAPIAYGTLYLVGYVSRKWLIPATLLILVILFSYLDPEYGITDVMWFHNNDYEARFIELAKDLNELEGEMLVTEAGALAYYTDSWKVRDLWGLNDREFIYNKPTNSSQLAHYDLIELGCPPALVGILANGYRENSWEHMCHQVQPLVTKDQFESYILRDAYNVECYSYSPIFYVNRDSKVFQQLRDLLSRYGTTMKECYGR